MAQGPRVLSKDEYEAIKQKVLADAPDGLSEKDFGIYAQREMARALGEAEAQPAPQSGAVGRFASGVVSSMGGLALGLGKMVTDPIGSARDASLAGVAEIAKAAEAGQQGHTSEMLGHGAAAGFPLVGPAAAAAGEQIASGDVAGGLGQGAAMVGLPLAVRAAPALARSAGNAASASRTPVAGALGAAADIAEHPLNTAGRVLRTASNAIKRPASASGYETANEAAARLTDNTARRQFIESTPPEAETSRIAYGAADPPAPPNPNAGGRSTGQRAPSFEDMLAGELQAEPTPRPQVTAPPQAPGTRGGNPGNSQAFMDEMLRRVKVGQNTPGESVAPSGTPGPTEMEPMDAGALERHGNAGATGRQASQPADDVAVDSVLRSQQERRLADSAELAGRLGTPAEIPAPKTPTTPRPSRARELGDSPEMSQARRMLQQKGITLDEAIREVQQDPDLSFEERDGILKLFARLGGGVQ